MHNSIICCRKCCQAAWNNGIQGMVYIYAYVYSYISGNSITFRCHQDALETNTVVLNVYGQSKSEVGTVNLIRMSCPPKS